MRIDILVANGWAASGDQSNAIFVTVGQHQITERQVDDAVLRKVPPSRVYGLRKQALDELVEGQLADEAAFYINLPSTLTGIN